MADHNTKGVCIQVQHMMGDRPQGDCDVCGEGPCQVWPPEKDEVAEALDKWCKVRGINLHTKQRKMALGVIAAIEDAGMMEFGNGKTLTLKAVDEFLGHLIASRS